MEKFNFAARKRIFLQNPARIEANEPHTRINKYSTAQ